MIIKCAIGIKQEQLAIFLKILVLTKMIVDNCTLSMGLIIILKMITHK